MDITLADIANTLAASTMEEAENPNQKNFFNGAVERTSTGGYRGAGALKGQQDTVVKVNVVEGPEAVRMRLVPMFSKKSPIDITLLKSQITKEYIQEYTNYMHRAMVDRVES